MAEEKKTPKKTPKTGDPSDYGFYLMLMLAAGGTVIALRKRAK